MLAATYNDCKHLGWHYAILGMDTLDGSFVV